MVFFNIGRILDILNLQGIVPFSIDLFMIFQSGETFCITLYISFSFSLEKLDNLVFIYRSLHVHRKFLNSYLITESPSIIFLIIFEFNHKVCNAFPNSIYTFNKNLLDQSKTDYKILIWSSLKYIRAYFV